jgi:hypothetical protein
MNIVSNPTKAGFLLSLYIPSVTRADFVFLSIPTLQEDFIEEAAIIKTTTPIVVTTRPM